MAQGLVFKAEDSTGSPKDNDSVRLANVVHTQRDLIWSVTAADEVLSIETARWSDKRGQELKWILTNRLCYAKVERATNSAKPFLASRSVL